MSFFDDEKAMSIVESYMFTFSDVVDVNDIVEIFNLNEIFIDREYVVHIIELLSQKYKEKSSGLEILKIDSENKEIIAKQIKNHVQEKERLHIMPCINTLMSLKHLHI